MCDRWMNPFSVEWDLIDNKKAMGVNEGGFCVGVEARQAVVLIRWDC